MKTKFEKKQLIEIANAYNVKLKAKATVEEIALEVHTALAKVSLKEMPKETKSLYLKLDAHFKRALRPIRVQEHTKRNPGVVETIVTMIIDAGKEGVTKADILKELVKKFPDRKAEGMKRTVNLHVPSCITRERFDVEKIEGTDKYRKAIV